jgi:hypothetical protein
LIKTIDCWTSHTIIELRHEKIKVSATALENLIVLANSSGNIDIHRCMSDLITPSVVTIRSLQGI